MFFNRFLIVKEKNNVDVEFQAHLDCFIYFNTSLVFLEEIRAHVRARVALQVMFSKPCVETRVIFILQCLTRWTNAAHLKTKT